VRKCLKSAALQPTGRAGSARRTRHCSPCAKFRATAIIAQKKYFIPLYLLMNFFEDFCPAGKPGTKNAGRKRPANRGDMRNSLTSGDEISHS
jgi:hypothetical protein